MYQIKGELINISETEQKTENFSLRNFVIKTEGQYSQEIPFQLANKNCDIINAYQLGSVVTIHFNLRGRSWTSPHGEKKWFATNECFKIDNNF